MGFTFAPIVCLGYIPYFPTNFALFSTHGSWRRKVIEFSVDWTAARWWKLYHSIRFLLSERGMTTLQVFMQMHSNTLGHKYFPTAYNHIDNIYK